MGGIITNRKGWWSLLSKLLYVYLCIVFFFFLVTHVTICLSCKPTIKISILNYFVNKYEINEFVCCRCAEYFRNGDDNELRFNGNLVENLILLTNKNVFANIKKKGLQRFSYSHNHPTYLPNKTLATNLQSHR